MNYDKLLKNKNYIFKFCKFDLFSLQIILNNTLYFSSFKNLNDPLDSRLNINIKNYKHFSDKTRDALKYSGIPLTENLKYLLKEHLPKPINWKKVKQIFTEYLTYYQNNFLGITCFSKDYNDNTIWAHYADQAKGICFVFEKDQLIKSLKENIEEKLYNLMQVDVTYEGVKKFSIILEDDGSFKHNWTNLTSKTRHWAYEEELRIMLEYKGATFPTVNYLPDFDPYVKFTPECLKYVIHGENMIPENISILDKIINNLPNTTFLSHKFDY
ncbi:MAG: DUF2971 domain-containing protein [Prolixibacteraceae bacterium]|nr:DUF2971 domain-containing protein [Prolixibacteraceae bacterium]